MSERTKSSRFFGLYTAVQSRLYAFILMIVHNHDEAEELLQETATLLWEKFDRYQDGTNFSAWAITVAKIKVFSHLRENKKHCKLFKTSLYEQLSDMAEPSSVDVSDRIKALDVCLWKLSKTQRDLLSMRYKNNLPVKEIARVKDKSPQTIYQILSQLFVALRRCIDRTLYHGNPA
jgi:RNA polymerase sigma-70 factor (ECF subfamily)